MEDQPNPPEAREALFDGAQASRIYLLPNLMTAGNLFFGFLAIKSCIEARFIAMAEGAVADANQLYRQAVLFILGGMLCDSLDGRLARLGGRESLFGKEFDSIADIVTFGVAPALMVLFLIINREDSDFVTRTGFLLAFIYLLCAGVRLARFNVLTHPAVYPSGFDRGDSDFVGLPSPAAAGMIATLVWIITKHDLQKFAFLLPWLMLFISWLMISSIRYPSFKKVDWNTRIRFQAFIGLLAAFGVIYMLKAYGLLFIFLAYLFWGVVRHGIKFQKSRKLAREKAQAAAQASASD